MIQICPEEQCTGCGACANICPKGCIDFTPDHEGFLFPQIDPGKCIDCGLCRKICPVNSPAGFHPEQKDVYAAWALDEKIRCTSSSGGLYSVFANHCIEQGGMANGVSFNGDLYAVQGLFDSPDQIAGCRGSKYVQCVPGDIYSQVKKVLEAGRFVFFTSTPCQVNALYKYLGCDHENLCTCDFICHGVPSPAFLKKNLLEISGGRKEISGISFRDLSGWGNYLLRLTADGENCTEDKNGRLYSKLFLAGVNYRTACYQCPFARGGRVADVTIGDFWGLGKYVPFFHDTRKGVSLLMINTPKGGKLLDKVKDQLFLSRRSFREAARENHQLYRRVKKNIHRPDFYQDAQELSGADMLKKYIPATKNPLWKKVLSIPRRIYCKMLRIFTKVFVKLFIGRDK